MSEFQKEELIPLSLFRAITDFRLQAGNLVLEAARKRVRRERFAPSGRINIVAADHPARGSVSVGEDHWAMADRHDLLARLVSVLNSEWVDGVLASMDILEELLMLHAMMEKEGGFLDEKLLIASLNRAGIPGTVWELNDPVTGTDAETCLAYGIDAAKLLLRVDPSNGDSLDTMMSCVDVLREMNRADLPVILEPLAVERSGGSYRMIREPEPMIRLIGIASALGSNSRNLWLKIPWTPDFGRVIQATTLPVVLLGGDRSDRGVILQELASALEAGHQVRGAMFGRNVLYPESSLPADIARQIGMLLHESDSKKPKLSDDNHET